MANYEAPAYSALIPMFTQCPPFQTCPPYVYLDKVAQLRFERDMVMRFAETLEIQLKAAHEVLESINMQLEKM